MKRLALGLFLALVAHNLYFLVRNQRGVEKGYRLVLRPRDLGKVAERNEHPVVQGRLAIFHYLGERIAGATLSVPPWMEDQRWFLERVARLYVRVSPTPILVAPGAAERLVREAPVHRRWLRRGNKREPRTWQELHILIEPGRAEYVWAETDAEMGPLFLLPRERLP